MRKATVSFLTILAAGLVATVNIRVADAATWTNCNGQPVKWRTTPSVNRNRCSIPDTGPVNAAYWNGINQWNRLTNVIGSTLVNPVSDCTTTIGDGQNEVGLVSRASLDGAVGRAPTRRSNCGSGTSSIVETDVLVANDLPFGSVWGNALSTTTERGDNTFVHEFGHFFGLDHEVTHSVMRTTQPRPIAGGLKSESVWPADTVGLNVLYPFTSSGSNILPSATGIIADDVVVLDSLAENWICRGESGTTRVYLGNYGNISSGPYTLRIRLSTTPPFTGYSDNSGHVVATFTHSLPAFSTAGNFQTLPFTVPLTGVSNGTYYLYYDMTWTGSQTQFESLHDDNTTVSAMKIVVTC